MGQAPSDSMNCAASSTTVALNSTSSITVCIGDLVTQQADVIVVCSSSTELCNAVFEAAGKSMKTRYDEELEKNPQVSIISLPANRKMKKKIYFLSCTISDKTTDLRVSIEKFVSDAIAQAIKEGYRNIAFPAVGCGKFRCPVSAVAQAMVRVTYLRLQNEPVSVSFVIQSSRHDIYYEFQHEILLLQPSQHLQIPSITSAVSGKSVVRIEKGDITKQEVQVIVGNSAAPNLMQVILEAAGDNIRRKYNAERKIHPDNILINTPPGNLPNKRIFFLQWEPDNDKAMFQQSLAKCIQLAVKRLIESNYTSIVFPAFECRERGYSADLIIDTMVTEIKNQLIAKDMSLTVKIIIQPDQPKIYDEFCKQLSIVHVESLDNQLPYTWEKVTGNKIRFLVRMASDEYKLISKEFMRSINGLCTSIIKIERIQNEGWYSKYVLHRRDLKRRLQVDTERRLYHGCPKKIADLIIKDRFNRGFAGRNGTLYGVGVYFSSNASYSHRYTSPNVNGERHMFVACVLIGKRILGHSSMKNPPHGYDSTTDGIHIVVTYHDDQAYAEYLITYK